MSIVEEDIKEEIDEVVKDVKVKKERMSNKEVLLKLQEGMDLCDKFFEGVKVSNYNKTLDSISSFKDCIESGFLPGAFINNPDMIPSLQFIFQFMDQSDDIELKTLLVDSIYNLIVSTGSHTDFNCIKFDKINCMLKMIQRHFIIKI